MKFKKLKFSNPFLKNVFSLTIGTIFSQIIVVFASPILTRIYTVDAFGLLSLFSSSMVIYCVLTTGRYEFAIGLPEKDEKAKLILKLIAFLGFITSILCLIIVFALKEVFEYDGLSGLFRTDWIYLAPIYSFFIALYSGLLYWNQRGKKYKKITKANAIQVVTTTIFSLLFGFLFRFNDGMLVALTLGVIVSSSFLLIEFNYHDLNFDRKEIFKTAKEYVAFPKYMIISDMSLTISQQFVPIIFSSLYSSTVVGYFSFANRMIRLPNIIITNSIASVFRNDAIDAIRIFGNCRKLYLSTLKKLILVSVPLYFIVFISSPFLFNVIFGKNWKVAGEISQILSVVLMIEFIVIPLNSLFYIKNKQKLYSKIQFVNMIFGIAGLLLGYYYFNSFYYSLIIYSFSNLLFYLILIKHSYKLSS